MKNVIFLTQFKKERIYDVLSNSIELEYDKNLDYNIFQSIERLELMSMTKTGVKVEQTDEVSNELSKEQIQKLYLETKSLTDVKTEQPDEIEENFYSELMSTQTFTKAGNEGSDQDY